MSFFKVLKIAEKFEKRSQSSMQAANVQAALGASPSNDRGQDKDYYAAPKVNSIINDIANRFKLDESTGGVVTLNMAPNGSITVVVTLNAEKQKEKAIANFLKSQFGLDMSKRVVIFSKFKNIPLGSPIDSISWFKF